MCTPTLNYTRENYSIIIEKLAFECDKNFSGAAINHHQQNVCMTEEEVYS